MRLGIEKLFRTPHLCIYLHYIPSYIWPIWTYPVTLWMVSRLTEIPVYVYTTYVCISVLLFHLGYHILSTNVGTHVKVNYYYSSVGVF